LLFPVLPVLNDAGLPSVILKKMRRNRRNPVTTRINIGDFWLRQVTALRVWCSEDVATRERSPGAGDISMVERGRRIIQQDIKTITMALSRKIRTRFTRRYDATQR